MFVALQFQLFLFPPSLRFHPAHWICEPTRYQGYNISVQTFHLARVISRNIVRSIA
jgi:hypothetical protein